VVKYLETWAHLLEKELLDTIELPQIEVICETPVIL
jgi:hypothetical protein